ncbi:adenosylcobinamide-phosphate synthase CbiB [Oryzifoliimicrobium ureilyticus]|uniref:adenosylcobinamide-phosphate synthase CbiB n=1 Tax=Oryzifoliimicrobium ureilyticus TaxID=3113724 RepID=UPI0030766EAC
MNNLDGHMLVLFLALLLDRLLGDPQWLWSRIPHPVVLFGKAISICDKRWNLPSLDRATRRARGLLAIGVLLAGSLITGYLLKAFFSLLGPAGIFAETLLVCVLLAQKSLYDHVDAVALGLKQDGLTGGCHAVSMIVGRDPATLDEAGICRAAIESLAENFSDGVVAPALWYVLLGLPGILAYKMLNTADSMIGHKNERYIDFGWASARLDDVANWPAARLSILLIAGGALCRLGRDAGREAVMTALRDGGLHRSPNSGRPEAAMAGALDLQLAGPRIYGGSLVREPMINAGGRNGATAGDIKQALAVFNASCSLLAAVALAVFVAFL